MKHYLNYKIPKKNLILSKKSQVLMQFYKNFNFKKNRRQKKHSLEKNSYFSNCVFSPVIPILDSDHNIVANISNFSAIKLSKSGSSHSQINNKKLQKQFIFPG